MARQRAGQGQGTGDDRVLVAAATKVPLTRKPNVRPTLTKEQKDALAYWRSVPEIKQLFLWRGNQIAKLRLFAAAHPDGDADAEPVPALDERSGINPDLAKIAGETLRRFRSSIGGQSEILRRMEMNLEAVGELWIVGFGERPSEPGSDEPPEPEEWIVCSISEIKHKRGRSGDEDDPGVWSVHRRRADKKGRELDSDLDDLFRVWTPDLEYGEDADCALLGALGPLTLLQALTDQMLAEARSRVPAGFFTFPNELTVSKVNPTQPAEGQEALADKTIDTIVTAWTEAVFDPSDPATLAPLLIRGPAAALGQDVLRKIDLSRSTGEELDKRIEGILKRVFRGMDAPPEVIEGHNQTTFANADQIDDDTFEDYLEPRAVLISDAVTVGYFRQQTYKAAVKAGIAEEFLPQIDRMFAWYDPSDIIAQPNPSEAADKGLELGAIGGKAWRKARGFDEGDAPDPIELILRMALTRGPLTPNVVVALLGILEPDINLPQPEAAGVETAQASYAAALKRVLNHYPQIIEEPREEAIAAVAAAVPALSSRSIDERDIGWQLTAIDRELRSQVLIACDAAMTRALERAGNKVGAKLSRMSKAVADTVRAAAPIERAQAAGLAQLADAGLTPSSLLDGAFDSLEDQYKQWAIGARDDAIELANRVVGGFTQAQRDSLGLRLSGSIDESWLWLKESLSSLAEAQLFDPHPTAPTIGEFDPSLRIPPGMVRQAVARAGGAAGLSTNGAGGVAIALTDGGTRPAGGLATGEIMRTQLRDKGVSTEGYEWDYGMARRARPFHPHRALDGKRFVNFDDSVLTNSHGWPPYPYFMPGDHDGCLCDVIPILMPPDGGLVTTPTPPPEPSDPLAAVKTRAATLRTMPTSVSASSSDRLAQNVTRHEQLRQLGGEIREEAMSRVARSDVDLSVNTAREAELREQQTRLRDERWKVGLGEFGHGTNPETGQPYRYQIKEGASRIDALKKHRLRVEKEQKQVVRELNLLRTAPAEQRGRAVLEVLSEVRPMGVDPKTVGFATGSSGEAKRVVQQMSEWYPSEWWEMSNNASPMLVKTVSGRGGYSGGGIFGQPRLTTTMRQGDFRTTTLHELGHRMEDVHPGITNAELRFWRERTQDGTAAGGLQRYRGGRADEIVNKDEFVDEYMGKSYLARHSDVYRDGSGGYSSTDLDRLEGSLNKTTSFEVLTMGMEELVFNHFGAWEKDLSYIDFIIGMLAGI